MTDKKDPNKETVTEAEAGVKEGAVSSELRGGLATGSQASNPDQPDGTVIQTTVIPSSPNEPTSVDLSVVTQDDGKKGPAA